jgi:sorbitol-specific phosphotransferase system component IIBC
MWAKEANLSTRSCLWQRYRRRAVLASLIPILLESGIGSDAMKPIAAPIVGEMITSTIHVMILTTGAEGPSVVVLEVASIARGTRSTSWAF